MSAQNAARAQYETTAIPSIGPPQHGQPHALPVTGHDVAWVLVVGLVLIALGTFIRPFVTRSPR